MAGKQAKILSEKQVASVLRHLDGTRHTNRNRVMVLLSVGAGLRAKEVANLTWLMVTESDGAIGSMIHLPDAATKRKSGRSIPVSKNLRSALTDLHEERTPKPADHVIFSERGTRMSAASVVQWFARLYADLGYDGCSSHSGRRTFVTRTARKISLVGGSLRDVQYMAGHSSLSMTARYIEADSEAMMKVVDLI